MRTTVTMWLLCGALVASAGLNVYHVGRAAQTAEPLPDVARCAGTQPVCPMVERLGLTESQRQQLVGCSAGVCGRECAARGQRLRELLRELESALNADPVDRQGIDRLADEIAGLRASEWKNRVNCILQVRETLTPSQLERLVASVEAP